MSLPRVAAVVLNWKDAASTRRCVLSLLDEDEVEWVIVIDNESDGSIADLAGPRIDVLPQADNLGFSKGVNIGLRAALAAGCDAVLVINNDATLSAGAMGHLLSFLDDDTVVAPWVMNPDGTVQATGGRLRRLTAGTSDLASGASIDYLTWACVLLPARVLREVGLLDESFFMYWEDVEYGLRLRRRGGRLVVAPAARVEHERSKSHGNAGAAVESYSVHGLLVLARRENEIRLWIGVWVRVTARLLRRALRGDAVRVRAVLRGVRAGMTERLTPVEFGEGMRYEP